MVKSGLLSVCLAIALWMSFEELHQLLALKPLTPASSIQKPPMKPSSLSVTSKSKETFNNTAPLNGEAAQKQFKQTVYEVWNIYDELEEQKSAMDLLLLEHSSENFAGPILPRSEPSKSKQNLDRLLFPDKRTNDNSSDFSYGYQTSKDEKHGVHLELKESGVSVSTDIQTDPEQGLEVQSINIKVDLPK